MTRTATTAGVSNTGSSPKKRDRQEALVAAREKRVCAAWFITLEGQSERIHFLQDGVSTLVRTSAKGSKVLGSTGYALPTRSAGRLAAKDKKLYQERVNEAIESHLERSENDVPKASDLEPGACGASQAENSRQGEPP